MPRARDLIGEDRRAFAYLVTQRDLDNLPRVYRGDPMLDGDLDARAVAAMPQGDAHATCRAIQAGEREAAEEQADALRSEVARLTGLINDTEAKLGRKASEWDARAAEGRQQVANLIRDNQILREANESLVIERDAARTERDEARAEVVSLGQQLDETGQRFEAMQERRNRARDHAVAAEEEAATLRRERDEARSLAAARAGTADHFRYFGAHESLELPVAAAGLVTCDGHELRIVYDAPLDGTLSTTTRVPVDDLLGTVEGDPRRPHPDAWPDDAVLLRYRELRDLVALHLDRYATAGPARAMRDGDVPLRLAEVLRP